MNKTFARLSQGTSKKATFFDIVRTGANRKTMITSCYLGDNFENEIIAVFHVHGFESHALRQTSLFQ